MTTRHIAILVANSARARIIMRWPDRPGLHTRLTIEDGPGLHGLGEGDDASDNRVKHKLIVAFIHVITVHLRELAQTHPLDAIVVAAPARMLKDLQAAVATIAPSSVGVGKDYLKLSDQQISVALSSELLQAEGLLGPMVEHS